MTDQIKVGQKVYNRSGHVAKYEGLLNGVHYVTPEVIIYGWEGEEEYDWGEPTTWPEVFPKPPSAVLEKEIAEAESTLKKQRAALAAEREDFRKQTAEHAEFTKRLEKERGNNTALSNLLDFIDGKITHVVVRGNYDCKSIYEVKTLAALERNDEGWDRKNYMPLVSLFGDSKGNLSFGINRYKEGSGGWNNFHPCRSEAEAEALAKTLVKEEGDTAFEAVISGKNSQPWSADRHIMAFRHYGFEVPQAVIDGYQARRSEAFNKRKAELEKQLNDHVQAYEAAQ